MFTILVLALRRIVLNGQDYAVVDVKGEIVKFVSCSYQLSSDCSTTNA